MSDTNIRLATAADVANIKTIAVDAEMFTLEEVGFFDEMLGGFFDGSLEGHQWLVVEDAGRVVAAANYAPEPFADRMWNVYFVAVARERQGHGLGGLLMAHIEQTLSDQGTNVARVVVVETSSSDQYARTREFYAGIGYDEEARIREFYGPGDDKVVFWKSLVD